MSSLLYTEEAGAAALVPTYSKGSQKDTGQVRWHIARRDTIRRMCFAYAGPLLYEGSSTYQLFPASGQQQISRSNDMPIHDRAAHAVRVNN